MKLGVSNEGKDLCCEALIGNKTITRRNKEYKVGSIEPIYMKDKVRKDTWILAGHVKIKSCIDDCDWDAQRIISENTINIISKETKREGYKEWENLWKDLEKFYGYPLPILYRIEFELSSYKA